MEFDNLIVYVSSRNNYDMLKGEVLNIDFEGFEFINVDDCSTDEEISKGKSLCDRNNIVYLQNKGRGVQMATQTLVDFINKHRPNCKYIICFQHDSKPISDGFFKTLSEYISEGKLDEFGGIGFNVLDNHKYTFDMYDRFKKGDRPLGILGFSHLGIASTKKRWISPSHNPEVLGKNTDKWSTPFVLEIPAWMVGGINIDTWNKYVKPTEEHQFHLWFPDVCMQLNVVNKPILIIPNLYCYHDQKVKSKYGIHPNSAHAAKNGDTKHFGKYSNFKAWKNRWGWDYEDARNTFGNVKQKYEGTILNDFHNHNVNIGPLKNYQL